MQYDIKKIQEPHISSQIEKFAKLTIKVIGNEKLKHVRILVPLKNIKL